LLGPGRPYLEEALRIFREIGHKQGIASTAWALAAIHQRAGDMTTSRALADESLALAREIGDFTIVGWAQFGRGFLSMQEGHSADALNTFLEAMRVFEEGANLGGIATALLGVTSAIDLLDEREHRNRLAGATYQLSESYGIHLRPNDISMTDVDRPADDPDAQRAWDEGAAMTVDEAMAYAREVVAKLSAFAQRAE
jgi:tetratricopeptide (TPR) repeat protein